MRFSPFPRHQQIAKHHESKTGVWKTAATVLDVRTICDIRDGFENGLPVKSVTILCFAIMLLEISSGKDHTNTHVAHVIGSRLSKWDVPRYAEACRCQCGVDGLYY